MTRRVRENLIRAGLLLGSIGGFLLAAELLVRFVNKDRGGKERHEEEVYNEYDPLLGWRKRPGARVVYRRREYTTEVAINSRGLRDIERPPQRPPGVLRILALGDSFLEGYTVNLPQTVTRVLDRGLNAGGCSADVINGGTNAYSTDQEYLFYGSEGMTYEPQIVVLFFYYNDVVYNDRQEYGHLPKPIFEMGTGRLRLHRYPVKVSQARTEAPDDDVEESGSKKGSLLYWWVTDRLRRGAPRTYQRLAALGLWEPILKRQPRLELRVYERRFEALIEDPWVKTEAILEALARDVERHGAKLLVAGVPSRLEVDERAWQLTCETYGADDRTWNRRAVMERLERIGDRSRFAVLDLTEPFRSAYRRGERPYFTSDGHWNAKGHSLAAEAIEGELQRLGWLTSCGRPPAAARR